MSFKKMKDGKVVEEISTKARTREQFEKQKQSAIEQQNKSLSGTSATVNKKLSAGK